MKNDTTLKNTGRIVKVSGPLVISEGPVDAKMYDVVRVSEKKLIGEVIEIRQDKVYIQVYEDTAGIGAGEPVMNTGEPLSVELGPGLVGSIYDGIQRPLNIIQEISGNFITRGIELPGLDKKKKWHFIPLLKKGDSIGPGEILGEVKETELVVHRVVSPGSVTGKIIKISEGDFTVDECILEVLPDTGKNPVKLTMKQKWAVREPRPYVKKLSPDVPLFTGQRVIDTFFPVAKGGTACVPGPFGSGKTVIQHQLAKWSDAEIVVYVGCGERGNEMTDVLTEFPELKDPKSGKPLILRTVMIANTSNMPVAAREASIYTGITIAEYFRDMGYSVALMADSTSRWAEALREISGRLEEMPGEEGYPAYLPKRLAEFYERAGRVVCLSGTDASRSETGGSAHDGHTKKAREGCLSVIGAVSPPGGDLSDPVVQGTLKVVKVFWSLEEGLAHARHFPAISWLTSYSRYHDELRNFYTSSISVKWPSLVQRAMELLQKESELKEIVRLVGMDAISDQDKIVLESARSIREDYLYQSAFDPVDTYSSAKKQYCMLKAVMGFYELAMESLEQEKELDKIMGLPVRKEISMMRFIPESELHKIEEIHKRTSEQMGKIG
ncbi:MAG: V-type ATP synthase subunit A [Elusimicrobiota bacterium]